MCSALSEIPEDVWVTSWDSICPYIRQPPGKGRIDNAQDLYGTFISLLAFIFLS